MKWHKSMAATVAGLVLLAGCGGEAQSEEMSEDSDKVSFASESQVDEATSTVVEEEQPVSDDRYFTSYEMTEFAEWGAHLGMDAQALYDERLEYFSKDRVPYDQFVIDNNAEHTGLYRATLMQDGTERALLMSIHEDGVVSGVSYTPYDAARDVASGYYLTENMDLKQLENPIFRESDGIVSFVGALAVRGDISYLSIDTWRYDNLQIAPDGRYTHYTHAGDDWLQYVTEKLDFEKFWNGEVALTENGLNLQVVALDEEYEKDEEADLPLHAFERVTSDAYLEAFHISAVPTFKAVQAYTRLVYLSTPAPVTFAYPYHIPFLDLSTYEKLAVADYPEIIDEYGDTVIPEYVFFNNPDSWGFADTVFAYSNHTLYHQVDDKWYIHQ